MGSSDLERLSDELIMRADAYEEPYGGSVDWVLSSSYPIAMALRETAFVIRKVLGDSNGS